jgi:hypothetical protein
VGLVLAIGARIGQVGLADESRVGQRRRRRRRKKKKKKKKKKEGGRILIRVAATSRPSAPPPNCECSIPLNEASSCLRSRKMDK